MFITAMLASEECFRLSVQLMTEMLPGNRELYITIAYLHDSVHVLLSIAKSGWLGHSGGVTGNGQGGKKMIPHNTLLCKAID